jgi:hypothetical protein
MDDVTIIQHWIEHHPPPLWAVAAAALALAWIDHRAKSQQMQRYDAWWFKNLRRSDIKLLRRSRQR